MAGPNLSGTVVGQLSQDAYGSAYAKPSGWSYVQEYSYSGQSFTVLANQTSHIVDFSFMGTNSASQFADDLETGGTSSYETIASLATGEYSAYTANPQYAGYTFICTGHSTGAEDCAAFAVAEDISGYGVNGLPVSSQLINNYFGSSNWNSLLTTWKNNSNSFQMFDVEGDPATLLYSNVGGGYYLNTSTTTYASPYAACEAAGIETATEGGPVGIAGVLATAYCAYTAHNVATEISLSQSSGYTGDTSIVNSDLSSSASNIASDVESYDTGSDSSYSAVAGTQSVSGVSVSGAGINYDLYSLTGSNDPLYSAEDVTGSGGVTISTNSTMIDILQGLSATISGQVDNILGMGSSDITVTGGNDGTFLYGADATVTQDGANGTLNLDGTYATANTYGSYDDSYLYGNYDNAYLYNATGAYAQEYGSFDTIHYMY